MFHLVFITKDKDILIKVLQIFVKNGERNGWNMDYEDSLISKIKDNKSDKGNHHLILKTYDGYLLVTALREYIELQDSADDLSTEYGLLQEIEMDLKEEMERDGEYNWDKIPSWFYDTLKR